MTELELMQARAMSRRTFFGRAGLGLGSLAVGALEAQALPPLLPEGHVIGRGGQGVRAAKAKAVIYLHMSGAPPSLDLFDYKPKLNELNLQDCPDSYLKGERFAFIKGKPKLLGSPHKFKQYGQTGAWMCDLLPHTASIADELAVIHSMSTEQFNHAPAELFLYTGNAFPGGAALGSWMTYGIGTANKDLPGFVVLLSGGTDPTGGKSLWSSGFLPSIHQGVQCRSVGDPILYLSDPPGMDRQTRRRSLDALEKLNRQEAAALGDPETVTRISQYELAYRMQLSVPDLMDIKKESQVTLDMYGAKPGESSFANNCLLARRLVEKGVRFVQLYDWGWDIHGTGAGDDLVTALPGKCRETDKACAALIKDLKQRGMLDDVLVVWGGEFGRTPMNEARGGSKFLGRDHNPNAFTIWMAGGGTKPGSYGQTDELGYKVVENKMTIRDLQATILDRVGLDPFKLHYDYQGLGNRLIGPTDEGRVIKELKK